MDRDEQIRLRLVRDRRARLQRDEGVVAARVDHVGAEPLLQQLARAAAPHPAPHLSLRCRPAPACPESCPPWPASITMRLILSPSARTIELGTCWRGGYGLRRGNPRRARFRRRNIVGRARSNSRLSRCGSKGRAGPVDREAGAGSCHRRHHRRRGGMPRGPHLFGLAAQVATSVSARVRLSPSRRRQPGDAPLQRAVRAVRSRSRGEEGRCGNRRGLASGAARRSVAAVEWTSRAAAMHVDDQPRRIRQEERGVVAHTVHIQNDPGDVRRDCAARIWVRNPSSVTSTARPESSGDSRAPYRSKKIRSGSETRAA